jgi:hypothetical protein
MKKIDLKKMTPQQMEKYVTKITGIAPDEGKKTDKKAGRTYGRYAKKKI